MRIGFALVNLALGGSQAFLVQLAQGMAERGHRVSYILASRRDDAYPSLVSTLDDFAEPAARPRDLLRCDAIQLDGYHSLRRKLPYLLHLDRCVETFHSCYSVRRSGPLYARHRVAVSRAVQACLRRPAELIYQGVTLPQEPDLVPKRFDVAILGRIHPVKQHLLFLHVCELLFRQRGCLDVLVIGGHARQGPYQQQVDAEMARLCAAGLHIHTTGEVLPGQVYSWLCQARILLITSQNEGFGRMALEALACGIPVIANPVGGLPEIVQAGQNGFFARPNDPESFASLAARLLNEPELRARLGRLGRAHVRSHFSLQAMLHAYERLYQRIAQGVVH